MIEIDIPDLTTFYTIKYKEDIFNNFKDRNLHTRKINKNNNKFNYFCRKFQKKRTFSMYSDTNCTISYKYVDYT